MYKDLLRGIRSREEVAAILTSIASEFPTFDEAMRRWYETASLYNNSTMDLSIKADALLKKLYSITLGEWFQTSPAIIEKCLDSPGFHDDETHDRMEELAKLFIDTGKRLQSIEATRMRSRNFLIARLRLARRYYKP